MVVHVFLGICSFNLDYLDSGTQPFLTFPDDPLHSVQVASDVLSFFPHFSNLSLLCFSPLLVSLAKGLLILLIFSNN